MKKIIKVFTLFGLILGLGILLVACGGGSKVALTEIKGDVEVSVKVEESKVLSLTTTPEKHDDRLVVTVEDATKVEATLEGNKLTVKGKAEGSSKVTISGEKATDVKHVVTVTVTPKDETGPAKRDVKFVVEVPAETNQVFIIGSFIGADWPIAEAKELTKGTDGKYSVTLSLEDGSYEYKYVNAKDWDYVEKDAEDKDIDNRTVAITAQTTQVEDTVAKWAKLWTEEVETFRGVTDTEIHVGNTAALSGGFGFVGIPFQAGIEVVFRSVNANGGIHGRTIVMHNRDDGGDPTKGVANTKALVEQDEVFAIVGHFAATVGATIDYLKQENVPMFYAANGTNLMYAEEAVGSPIFPVQPISATDGRMMLARALTNPIHGEGEEKTTLDPATAKIGVMKALTSGSAEMVEGIEIEARIAGIPEANLIIQEYNANEEASRTAAAQALKSAGVDAILLPLSQQEFKDTLPALIASGNTAPTYGSYFVADATAIPESYAWEFPIYANAWLDITATSSAADVTEFVTLINSDPVLTEEQKTTFVTNAFAMAGYIAAKMFVQSIERLGNLPTAEFSVEKYIQSNESAPFNVPMGGNISFENGSRIGISELALLQFAELNEQKTFVLADVITNISDLQAKYKK